MTWAKGSTNDVERDCGAFGLSLIYRGLDKNEEKDTGIFVARVIPGGQAARCGVRENDKIFTINAKTPGNMDDAVSLIKQAGTQIQMVVLREEHITINEAGSSVIPVAMEIEIERNRIYNRSQDF